MSQNLQEIALLEDVSTLPSHMQKVYLQLVSAIDRSLQKLRDFGANPDQISEEFIEQIVNKLLAQELSQHDLEDCVDAEFHRQILESTSLLPAC